MATRQRGDLFQADFMVAGVRHRESFPTQAEAEAWELEARAALKMGRPLPTPKTQRSATGGSLAMLGGLFDYVEREHWRNNPKITSPETAVRCAREVVEFFGRNKLVAEIDEEEMRRLVRYVVESGRTHQTADRRLAALSKMLRFAQQKGVIGRVPAAPLSGIKTEHQRYLSPAEAQRILALWQAWGQMDLHAFTVFALHCGARLSALLRVRWAHFGPGFNTVLFLGGDKKSPPRTLRLSMAARDAILEMHEHRSSNPGPFSHLKKDGRLRTMWDRMQKQLGFEDVVIHTLRHTCASWLIQGGMNLSRVQKWLGHKDIKTTLIYAHLAPDDLNVCADVLGANLAPPLKEAVAA
jgi:integrase